MSLRLEQVGRSRKLTGAFVGVPRNVYAGNPNWVPPLTSAARRAMNPRRNPFHRFAEIEHFVLVEGSRPIGRIAATIYPPYLERYEPRTGFFGFFETQEESPEVAQTLLRGAEEWLRERGMERCAGPYNYCSTQEMGLLIEGFDEPPAIFQTYNPPGYRRLLEACGYELSYTMSTFKWTVSEHADLLRAMSDQSLQSLEEAGLSPRPFDRRHFRRETQLLYDLFNESFAENSDVIPYEEDVFRDMVSTLRPFLDERLISIYEKEGRPVAFTVMIPNVNEVLSAVDGRFGPRDLIRLRQYRRSISSAVLLVIGALPEARGGVGAGLVGELGRSCAGSGYESLHTTWINDDNAASRALAEAFGSPPDKRYAIFKRDL